MKTLSECYSKSQITVRGGNILKSTAIPFFLPNLQRKTSDSTHPYESPTEKENSRILSLEKPKGKD
jgi:hypothetical protein